MRPHRRTTITAISLTSVSVGALIAGASLALPAQATPYASLVTPSTVRTASAASIYGAGPLLSTVSEASQAAQQLAANNDPTDASAARTIASIPTAVWLGEWTTGSTLTNTLNTATQAAAQTGETAVFVTYDIPDRDCGGYSAGGMTDSEYTAWVNQIASTLQGTRSVVIVEPDSLAMLSNAACANVDPNDRYALLNHEVSAFTAAGVPSYLDAGNSNWVPAKTMAQRLIAAGVRNARGFFSNVSNYYATANEQAYDEQVAAAIGGGTHYIIDTSRNGQGWKGTWCNAPGAGLGATPRIVGDSTGLDALLYVKTPGASDGDCNDGEPAAGVWFPSYATALVRNADLQRATASTPGAPQGRLDSATVVTAGVHVAGWVYDPAATSTPLTVTVTEDGTKVATATANQPRPDVDAAYHVGAAHGYALVVRGASGSHTMCVTATNAAGTISVQLGCRSVNVPASGPVGRLDAATSPAKNLVRLTGWAFDRDGIGTPLTIHITFNGRTLATTTASRTRNDVNALYGAGASHGYDVTFPIVAGSRTLCAVAVNIGSGSNTTLGCKSVSVG